MQSTVLVVDDEPKIVRLARDYLEKNGFRVVSAGDGPSALAMARREKPDLIVLDLLLPGMDGREVCRILRNESDVPIIMLTALLRRERPDRRIGDRRRRLHRQTFFTSRAGGSCACIAAAHAGRRESACGHSHGGFADQY